MGSHIPVVLRCVVGAGWFGIEAYSGSLAALMIALVLANYGGGEASAIVLSSFRYVVLVISVYVALASAVVARG
jgi:cytosine/uracil/thiamine/allantoin permease